MSLHLVEVSPWLSQMQYNKLTGQIDSNTNTSSPSITSDDSEDLYYKSATSRYGSPVFWYKQLPDVPKSVSFFIAHEFFDALPIHKFQVSQRLT